MKNNQKGFTIVEVLIVLLVIGLIGGATWYVLQSKDKKSPATNTSQTQQEASKETDTNEGYLVVKEWGLRFKTPSGLSDVRYTVHDDRVDFFAKPADSSVQYRSDYDKFENGRSQYATGVLYRSTGSTKPLVGDTTTEGKKVGDYYYYTAWSFSGLATGAACVGLYGDDVSSCEPEVTAFRLVNQGDTALLNTIELAQ